MLTELLPTLPAVPLAFTCNVPVQPLVPGSEIAQLYGAVVLEQRRFPFR
jgi:hypothetical protein